MWKLTETIAYYKGQGAPSDQTALVSLLREVQHESGGSLPADVIGEIAGVLGVKESYLLAIIKRIPSLRLGRQHCLQMCAGPNCGRHAALAARAETLCRQKGITLQYVPCMRLCGKGPNIKWDGTLYHQADEALLCLLINGEGPAKTDSVD